MLGYGCICRYWEETSRSRIRWPPTPRRRVSPTWSGFGGTPRRDLKRYVVVGDSSSHLSLCWLRL